MIRKHGGNGIANLCKLAFLTTRKFEPICFFYEDRRASGLLVEKKNSIFAKGGYTDKEAERNILSNPFKRFEDMQMLRHTKTLGIIQVEETVWKHLTKDEKNEIARICDDKLRHYYFAQEGKTV